MYQPFRFKYNFWSPCALHIRYTVPKRLIIVVYSGRSTLKKAIGITLQLGHSNFSLNAINHE